MNHRDSLMHLKKPKVGIYLVMKNELVFAMVPTEKAEPYGDALQHGGHHN